MSTITTLADILAPHRGITAVIGSGGKSTLLAQGGRALAARGATVTLATTTHAYPTPGVALAHDDAELAALLVRDGIATVGQLEPGTGKMVAPACGVPAIAHLADYTLVEADGSRCLPLKAHADYEPVIPTGCTRTVAVVGASGLNRPIREVVHRPQIFCELTGASLEDAASPELIAACIAAEGLVGAGDDLVIINQAEAPCAQEPARQLQELLARALPCPVYRGSLTADTFR